MILFEKKNAFILYVSLFLLALGFLLMKLEPAPHGYGPLALTVAPLPIVSGFSLGVFAIFFGTIDVKAWKSQRPILIAGWAVFLVSLVVYMRTLEDTASLWDCAEFIACAYKLQVPHAPGAPLFLMIGRIFSFLAFGDRLQVAYWINTSSALSSALTVMFTFWTVVMLGRKIKPNADNFTLTLSGITGSLVIAFADSFWFSAVEAETYAMATFFFVLVFWAILKWEKSSGFSNRARWIIFIFYMLGLSIGVHPMSLLVLPACAAIIIFHLHGYSFKNLMLVFAAGAAAILFLNHIILFGLPDIMTRADIFFVNKMGLPFYSGAICLILLLIASGLFLYRMSIKKRQKSMAVVLVGFMYFLIGYSSYFMIIIRSQADPSIDEHNPENLVTLTSYLKRESYGGRPLFYGQNFTAKIESFRQGRPVYAKMDDHYMVTDHKTEYMYEKSVSTILPRMYSNQPEHIATYRAWTSLKEGQKPGFVDNMKFMIKYQLGHMYFRYFMFNFSGRASDRQHDEWLSVLDVWRKVPDVVKANKARNNFLSLPLLLGVLGIFYQYRKQRGDFWAVMLFFLFLGLILVFYLNAPPNEPRERDYIYVGSWLAFSLWCGLGVMGIIQFLITHFNRHPAIRYSGLLSLLVPALMLTEGFDDHNRSGRTLQIDHARNTLAACAPGAILFTGGDNDTFPLWYVQEVEDFRTDVRVIVLSYFNGDWYIDQMKRRIYESDPLPISLEIRHYRQGGLNDVLPYAEHPNIAGAIDLKKFMSLVKEENSAIRVSMTGGSIYNSVPSRTFSLNIDGDEVKNSGLLPEAFHTYIPQKLEIPWRGNYLEKSNLMVLDIIANGNWKRPIYFNITSLNALSLDLKRNVLQEGHVYRLLPVNLEREGGVDVERLYENLMEKSVYGDLGNQDIYYNYEDYQLRILQATKSNYHTLARALLDGHQGKKAGEVLDFVLEKFMGKNINADISHLQFIDLLFRLQRADEALSLAERLSDESNQWLAYYYDRNDLSGNNGRLQLYLLRELYNAGMRYGQLNLAEKCLASFNEYYAHLTDL